MRICEIISDIKYKRTLITIAEKQGVVDYWWSSELEDGRQVFTMVVTNDSRQSVLDSLQILFEEDSRAKILVLPVDASIPRLSENTQDLKQVDQKTTREELYENVVKGVDLNLNFILMVIFSTIVVTIGLSEDNIAVVGITDFAQGELGDIVFVTLPSVEESFSKGSLFLEGHCW
mgnify:CR=1 FL=1